MYIYTRLSDGGVFLYTSKCDVLLGITKGDCAIRHGLYKVDTKLFFLACALL